MMKGLLIGFGILISVFVFAEQITGRVVTVIDGNTVEVAGDDKENYKILLFGIDCPESEQAFGDQAKNLLEKLLLNRSVKITIQGKDRWGTRMGVVVLEGSEDDPRYELLKEGLAWTAERNPIQELESIKEQARQKGKGLWQNENPTPPWIFRRQQTMMQPKSS